MADLLAALLWYLLATLLGLMALPVSWRLFHRLPDRGYGFSRSLGLLAIGYLLWLSATLGLAKNRQVTILGLLVIGLGVSLLVLRGNRRQLQRWLRQHTGTVLVSEVLFLLAFAAWTFVRASSPEIVATEKPMELAFINSVVHSETFPPADPWLSGFAISYYYFGFILVGLLTKATAVAPGVAFNLTNAMWFALTVLASYSLVHNLISARARQPKPVAGLLGPLFVVVTGNLEGFLEILHGRRLFWRQSPQGEWTSAFWRWLDIKTLVVPPAGEISWIPDRHWWWWRASRVVRDLNVAGLDHEVIDEFPFFSFLLADNHPHVLALPFVLLALGFAFQIYLGGKWQAQGGSSFLRRGQGRALALGGSILLGVLVGGAQLAAVAAPGAQEPLAAGIARLVLSVTLPVLAYNLLLQIAVGTQPSYLGWGELVVGAWLFGSLAFLNTWDFPIYLSLLFFTMLHSGREGGGWENLRAAATTSLALLLVGVLLYLPWYPTFSSQAGGVLPNLAFPTKFQQFFVMFAPSLVPIAAWLVLRSRVALGRRWKQLLLLGLGLPLALLLLSWLLGAVAALVAGDQAVPAALEQMGVRSLAEATNSILLRRLQRGATALALGLLVAAVWISLRHPTEGHTSGRPTRNGKPPVWPFVAILTGVGGLLVLGPEFLYLKDLFGTRMNTVFKFYFAAWILWGVAAAFASYELWHNGGRRRTIVRSLVYLPLLLGLCYPVMSLVTRTEGFSPSRGRTLDGTAHLTTGMPADARAIDWLNENVEGGTIAEAVGGSYSQFARISTHTSLVTVLGWEFHEVQWRGSADLQGTRRADIERLYRTSDWQEAEAIVDRYGIDYVYLGPLERGSYGNPRERKFEAFMTPIYGDGEVVIFARADRAVTR